MKNRKIAKVFYEIADILEIKGVKWKPQAYRRAAKAIEMLQDDIEVICRKNKLEDIPGVGSGIAEKIAEYIKTGKINEYNRLLKTLPPHMNMLMKISGMGPSRIKILHNKLNISTINELEKAAKAHKIAKLKGFWEKLEKDILEGIASVKNLGSRKKLQEVLPIARAIIRRLKKSEYVDKISLAGSLRRMKSFVRDIDILAASKYPEKVIGFFIKSPSISKVVAKGSTRSTVLLKNGLQVDLRVVRNESWGSALQYFTGSKEHSIKLRELAIKKGFKLNEYGLFDRKTNKKVAGKKEEGIYRKLGLSYIKPKIRENRGEIEAAKK